MKDEYKVQSSPAGTRCRHGEADDFASGRALAYDSSFRGDIGHGGNPAGCGRT
jgi:hypothetical protein